MGEKSKAATLALLWWLQICHLLVQRQAFIRQHEPQKWNRRAKHSTQIYTAIDCKNIVDTFETMQKWSSATRDDIAQAGIWPMDNDQGLA